MSNSEYRISDNFYDYLTFAFSLRKKTPTKKKKINICRNFIWLNCHKNRKKLLMQIKRLHIYRIFFFFFTFVSLCEENPGCTAIHHKL